MAKEGYHCDTVVKSFTFLDGETIKLCGNPACTRFDEHRREVLGNTPPPRITEER